MSPLDAKLDEDALLAALRGRNAQERDRAWVELFHAMKEQAFALAFHITGNRADAEDAVQDTFLTVRLSLPQFRGDSRLTTWVTRVAIHCAIARHRKRPLERNVEPLNAAAHVAGTERAPDELAIANDDAARVQRAMRKLSPDQRTVLTLFSMKGWTHPEIAEALAIPEGTVWSRLHLARKRLQSLLLEVREPALVAPASSLDGKRLATRTGDVS
jgi:RNA polymerase sigma-70 factor (ECF subfamily)